MQGAAHMCHVPSMFSLWVCRWVSSLCWFLAYSIRGDQQPLQYSPCVTECAWTCIVSECEVFCNQSSSAVLLASTVCVACAGMCWPAHSLCAERAVSVLFFSTSACYDGGRLCRRSLGVSRAAACSNILQDFALKRCLMRRHHGGMALC